MNQKPRWKLKDELTTIVFIIGLCSVCAFWCFAAYEMAKKENCLRIAKSSRGYHYIEHYQCWEK